MIDRYIDRSWKTSTARAYVAQAVYCAAKISQDRRDLTFEKSRGSTAAGSAWQRRSSIDSPRPAVVAAIQDGFDTLNGGVLGFELV